ncbi:MAG TPA: hypothetical protein VFF02_16255 [Anaeromyxobacteraceae bacterium]|nr:hypothetical protein [Anaeromyxobacteraceae bacterium]
MAELQEGPPAVELLEVEEELDLDPAFVASELAEAAGQGAGVEGREGKGGHGVTSVEDDPW